MTYQESQHYYERAAAIPGRSLTRSKAPGRMFPVGAGPMYAVSWDGARITDVDGHEFIDMLCALGAVSLGYGVTAPMNSLSLGVGSLPSFLEPVAAELVLAHVAPWASHVRFTKTGSEATHAAYRIARRATGRPFTLVGNWAYHGWHEWCERRPDGQPESFHTLRYAHGERLDETLGHGVHPLNVDPYEVSAVFVEPHRWEPVDVGWLRAVREFCTTHGILLVFDEMIYAGRWALGGGTAYFGVVPDIACYGKAIGNGSPIACVVGREVLKEHGELVSGTYSGDAGALESLCQTLRIYSTTPVIETLWTRGRQLQRGLQEVVEASPVKVYLEGQPVHQRLRFENYLDGQTLSAALVKCGVLQHPDCINICAAHTEADIEKVIETNLLSIREVGRDAR